MGVTAGRRFQSARTEKFKESVIREMTRLALQHGAVNLAQGFPDFSCPAELKAAAKAAIDADVNQYAITWGAQDFRRAIAEKAALTYPGWDVDPETQICVTCGSTDSAGEGWTSRGDSSRSGRSVWVLIRIPGCTDRRKTIRVSATPIAARGRPPES